MPLITSVFRPNDLVPSSKSHSVFRASGLVPSSKSHSVFRASGLVPSPKSHSVFRASSLVPCPKSHSMFRASGLILRPLGMQSGASTKIDTSIAAIQSNGVSDFLHVVYLLITCSWFLCRVDTMALSLIPMAARLWEDLVQI